MMARQSTGAIIRHAAGHSVAIWIPREMTPPYDRRFPDRLARPDNLV